MAWKMTMQNDRREAMKEREMQESFSDDKQKGGKRGFSLPPVPPGKPMPPVRQPKDNRGGKEKG
jgi:hypothetical protein